MKFVIAIAIVTVFAGSARGEPRRIEPLVGVSGGVTVSTDEPIAAVVTVRGGGLLSPNLAVIAEGSALICNNHQNLGLGVQYWPWERTWLSYSVGVARRAAAPIGSGCSPDEFKRNTGFWSGVRWGRELLRSRYYSLELSLRADYEIYFDAFKSFEDEERTDVQISSVGLEFGVSFF